MKIGGFVKNSFVDYPNLISSVIFTIGCNLKCWYCHNSHLLDGKHKLIKEEEIFEFLISHKGFIDGVVISGGEPTLQEDLVEFIKRIKSLGYKIKLDTNGTNFEVLKDLIKWELIDYVAMDIKAPIEDYAKIVCVDCKMDDVNKSIELLLNGQVDYEFRTTFSPDLTLSDIEKICKTISGAKTYSIQKYNFVEYNKKNMPQRLKTDFEDAKKIAEKYVKNVLIKGV